MTSPFKIDFDNICKTFSGNRILESVNITLHSGKAVLLTGENGAGKTTLLKILAGLVKPESASVNFGSQEEPWGRVRKRLLEKMMYLHQHPYMFEGSVRKNLALGLPRSMGKQKMEEKIESALEWGVLNRFSSSSAKTLSGGQQQRLALARAWLRQSRFLLLDEPIANMDSPSSTRTIKLLHQLKNDNTSILICSHSHMIFDSLIDHHIELVNHKLVEADSLEYSGNITSINREKSRDNAVG